MATGTLALKPSSIVGLGRRTWQTAWDATALFVADQGLTWAGAIGLYLFLSVPPLMVAVAWLARLVAPPEAADAFVVEQVAKYVPAKAEMLAGIVSTIPSSIPAAAGSIALLLFSASRAFAAMTSAINVMWMRVDELTYWRRNLLRLGMLSVSLALVGVAAVAEGLIARLAANGSSEGDIWLLDWQLVPMVLLGVFLFAAYKVLPREWVDPWHAAIGAVLATSGVRFAQAGLGWVSEAGAFGTAYGDLADVALMTTWALVVGVIVLYGAAIVAVLDGKGPPEEGSEGRFARSRASSSSTRRSGR